MLCCYCAKVNASTITCGQMGDLAFISTGYHNLRAAADSRKGFAIHQHSTHHNMAIQALSNTFDGIGELLSDAYRAEKDMNKQMLLYILPLGTWRQGLAYRGHSDDASNFMQLLKLRSTKWLENKGRKYALHDV